MATTVEVGNIQARITATTARFDSAIRRVNTKFSSLQSRTKSVRDRIKDLNKSFDALHKRLESVAKTGAKMQKWFAAATAGAVGLGMVLVNTASDAVETRNKLRESFGDMTEETLRWAATTAAAYGRSQVQVQQYLADLQAILAPTLQNREQAALMSKELTKLALDLASFHNVAEDEALQRLRSGLLGSVEATEILGINLRQTELEAEMLRLGWRKAYAQLTEQEKILLRFNVILRATRDAQGDVIRNSDQWANVSRALTSSLRDAAANLGNRYMPVVTELGIRATRIVNAFNQLDEAQIDLIARFGALTAAVMAGGLAFSTVLVILPQFVKGLQIVMSIMGAFASPWVLGIAAVVAAAFLLKRAWDENLGGIQERTETVTASVRRSWERLAAWFSGESDLFDAPSIGPGMRREQRRFALPSLPAPDWDRTIEDATARASEAWNRARASIAAFPVIELPAVEWPGWPEIDTEPFVAQWEQVRADIAALEAPPIPAGVEGWVDRVAESFRRTPAGQVTVNIGELAKEVMAGEKSFHDAVLDLIGSNLSIPFTALLWTLVPIGTGWRLALTGVVLALNFLPNIDLSASGLEQALNDAAAQVRELLERRDLIQIGDQAFSASEFSFIIGESIGNALAEAVLLGFGFVAGVLGVGAQIADPAFELGRSIGEQIVEPFTRGLFQGFWTTLSKALADAVLPKELAQVWGRKLDELRADFDRVAEERGVIAASIEIHKQGVNRFLDLFRQSPARNPETPWWQQDVWTLLETIFGGHREGTPWTGYGPLDEVAGVVHRQEAVIPADVLREGPGAVLEFLGAPGFQGGKLGAPLGAVGVQAEANRLTQVNEESLGRLEQVSKILGGLRSTWDKAGDKLEQIADETPFVRELVELVRILVGLAQAGATPPSPTATLQVPEPTATPSLMDRLRAMLGNALAWLKEQGQAAGESLKAFGANILHALTPVGILAMLLNELTEPVAALIMPITMVVSALAQALLPVFKTLFPIIKTFGIILLTVLQGISTVWNSIVGTIGNIFKSLSQISILGVRPLKFLEKTANFFLGLQVDTKALSEAQKELRDLTWEEALERAKNIDAIKKTTEALRNVPSGFKVALARFQAATPVQSFATGGYVPATPGGRIVRVAEGGEGEYIVPESKMGRSLVVNVSVQGDVYGVDDLDRRINTSVRRALQRGGMATYGVT